jgi:alkaline phosphatase D
MRQPWIAALRILMAFAIGLHPLAARAQAPATFTHGVGSGEVTDRSVVLWTRVDRPARLTVEVAERRDFSGKVLRAAVVARPEGDFTARATVGKLRPARRYFYRWRHGEAVSEVGTFQTAPRASDWAGVRLAWTGDSDPSRIGGVPVFNDWETLDAVRRDAPDAFVYLGDTIYSDFRAGGRLPDVHTLDEFRGLYRAAREFEALRGLARTTPFIAQWDDHEVRDDWDGETVDRRRLAIGRQAFLEYMPLTEPPLLDDPACPSNPLFRIFRWGTGADVIVLDTRSCRSASVEAICRNDLAPTMPRSIRALFGDVVPPEVPAGCLAAIHDPARTMLGRVQKERFKTALQDSRAQFKIVVTSVPIQQMWVQPYDAWEGYAAERAEILTFIRDQGIAHVIFLTTDGHQNVLKPVYIDRVADPAPLAYEAMTGPVATVTWQNLIAGAIGPAGVVAQHAIHTLLGAECRHMDAYSYGLLEIDPVAGTGTLALKDDRGNVLRDQVDPARVCRRTIGP